MIGLADPSAAARIGRACQTTGFFVVADHGVPEPVVEAAWSTARQFFDLPLSSKLAVRAEGVPYGYDPVAAEALGRTRHDGEDAPDAKQSFNLGPPNRGPGTGFGSFDRIWPTEPYELRPAWLSYYSHMESLADALLSLFAEALGLDRAYFEPFTREHLSALRALDYPEGSVSIRAGAHADYGTLTILRPDPAVGGLEVWVDGRWLRIPAVGDGFVINIGDLMHRWTNGRWKSALHRVVADPEGRRRASIAFFHNPDWDATIEPILTDPGGRPAFPAITAGPWLQAKFEAALAP